MNIQDEYKKIIDYYINTYNLKYLTTTDIGREIYRKCLSHMDIDLRQYNKELILQFWTFKYTWIFEWPKSREEFFQIIKCINFDNTKGKGAIHIFMDFLLKGNKKHIAKKYGLK